MKRLWAALRHPERPFWLLRSKRAARVLRVKPVNFAIPLMGAFDDLVILTLALRAILGILSSHAAQPAAGLSRRGGSRR